MTTMAKPARSRAQEELMLAKAPAKKTGRTPEEIAQAAVARMPTTVSGHPVKLTPTLFVTREVAEYVVARKDSRREEHAGRHRGHPEVEPHVFVSPAPRRSAQRERIVDRD
jgi:hypothetical protein